MEKIANVDLLVPERFRKKVFAGCLFTAVCAVTLLPCHGQAQMSDLSHRRSLSGLFLALLALFSLLRFRSALFCSRSLMSKRSSLFCSRAESAILKSQSSCIPDRRTAHPSADVDSGPARVSNAKRGVPCRYDRGRRQLMRRLRR